MGKLGNLLSKYQVMYCKKDFLKGSDSDFLEAAQLVRSDFADLSFVIK
jgi:hypothetical protein